MFLSIALILAGLLGPAALLMWRRGLWLNAADWIRDNISAPAVAAAPFVGVLVSFVGLMLIWPPAILFTLLAALLVLAVMRTAARPGGPSRMRGLGLPAERLPRSERRARDVG
jgi:hypothetical protein